VTRDDLRNRRRLARHEDAAGEVACERQRHGSRIAAFQQLQEHCTLPVADAAEERTAQVHVRRIGEHRGKPGGVDCRVVNAPGAERGLQAHERVGVAQQREHRFKVGARCGLAQSVLQQTNAGGPHQGSGVAQRAAGEFGIQGVQPGQGPEGVHAARRGAVAGRDRRDGRNQTAIA